jgi:hypothetical protein
MFAHWILKWVGKIKGDVNVNQCLQFSIFSSGVNFPMSIVQNVEITRVPSIMVLGKSVIF